MEIKWGIIGVGDVTEVKSGPAFRKVAGSQLVAVMRRNEEKVKDYALRHGVPVWYTDAMQLINDPEVNAIYVATPPDSHAFYARAALEAGKPVYLEKPMTRNSAEARELAEVVERTGGKLTVAHYRRQQPYFKKVQQLIAGHIGVPRLASLQYWKNPLPEEVVNTAKMRWRFDPSQSGGGLFHDIAPHQVDLLYYFFGEPLQSSGISANQAGLYAADDVVTGYMHFPQGLIFSGLWAFNVSEDRDQCEVIGSEGTLRFSFFNFTPIELENNEGKQYFAIDPLPHVQQPMIEVVVNYFRGEGENPCSVREGMRVMEIMESFTSPTQ